MISRNVVILLVSVLLGCAAAAAVFMYGNQDKLPGGLVVSGWDVGGIKLAELESELESKTQALGMKKVKFTASLAGSGDHERFAALGELGLRSDPGAVLAEMNQLLSGSVWERAYKRFKIHWGGREASLPVGIDPAVFAVSVKKMWPELYETQPIPARRVISGNDRVTYIPEVDALRADTGALLQEVLAAAHSGGNTPIVVDGVLLAPLFPAEAMLSLGGIALSEQPLSVNVPVYTLKADVTVASLKAEGIDRVISRYSTSFGSSGAGRVHNVSSAASVVHDMILAPEEVFDFGKVIKETERQFGFREAPVIVNGKLVPGIGGGICQVSSTLYNAALLAGLEIVERRNHSLPVRYAPLGRDATFANGHINFRFKNTTGKHLLIRTSSSGGMLSVKMFGTMQQDVSYEIKSSTVKTIEPPAKYVRNPSLPKGSVKLIQSGRTGYIVETYRIKKVGGKIVDKEMVSRDTYKAQPSLYASNSGAKLDGSTQRSRPPRNTNPIIEDGVQGPVYD